MKKLKLLLLLLLQSWISFSQQEPIRFMVRDQPIYPILSVGVSYNPEHGFSLPKVMISLQNKEDGGFYIGTHFVTALAQSFSQGIHAGFKSDYATIEYSWSGNHLKEGMGANNEKELYYKSSHNINLGFKYNPVWARLNVPLRFTRKNEDINEYFDYFPTIKGHPIGFELLYTDNFRKIKKM